MKTYGGIDVQIHVFLTTAQVGITLQKPSRRYEDNIKIGDVCIKISLEVFLLIIF
jgi:hypothetical protein